LQDLFKINSNAIHKLSKIYAAAACNNLFFRPQTGHKRHIRRYMTMKKNTTFQERFFQNLAAYGEVINRYGLF